MGSAGLFFGGRGGGLPQKKNLQISDVERLASLLFISFISLRTACLGTILFTVVS